MSQKVKRFWVSWVQPTNDPRPITYPPNDAICGWWVSGYDSEDQAIICAVVEAAKEIEVRRVLITDWPEVAGVESLRFCEEKPLKWQPGDRFPPSDWMRGRL